MMAAASQGMVIGFNVLSDTHLNQMAEKEHVEIQLLT